MGAIPRCGNSLSNSPCPLGRIRGAARYNQPARAINKKPFKCSDGRNSESPERRRSTARAELGELLKLLRRLRPRRLETWICAPATSPFDGHVSGFNVETIHYFQLKSNLKMNIDYSSDLKARLLAHDSFTQDNASLIEESEKSRSAAFKENKLLESLDVDPINNPFNVDSFRRPHRTLNDSQQIVFTSKSLYRWILTVVLGIGIAFCAYFIQNAITVTPILGSRTKRFRLTGVVRRC